MIDQHKSEVNIYILEKNKLKEELSRTKIANS